MSQPAGPALHRLIAFAGQRVTALQPMDRNPVRSYSFPAASGVTFGSLGDGPSAHWTPEECDDFRAVTCIAFHPHGKYIALADRRATARIVIYSWPTKRCCYVLKDSGDLSIADMTWDRTGSYFAVLGGAPKHTVSVYEFQPNGQLKQIAAQTDDVSPVNFTQISFDPRGQTDVCASGGGRLRFFKTEEQDRLGQRLKLKLTAVDGRSSADVTCHTWLTAGDVLAGTSSGALLACSPVSGVSEECGNAFENAIVGVITTKHCVAACDVQGTVKILSHSTHLLLQSVLSPVLGPVTSFAFTAHDTFIVGSAGGVIGTVTVPGLNSPTPLSTDDLALLAPKVAIAEESFGAAVTAIMLPDEEHVCAVSRDGLLRTRNLKSNQVIARAHVGVGPACVMNAPSNLVMTLHTTGTIRFVDPKTGVVQHQLRVSTDDVTDTPRAFAPINRSTVIGHRVYVVFGLKLFVVDTDLRTAIGYVTIPDVFEGIHDLTFVDGQLGLCVLSTANSSVILLKFPLDMPPAASETQLPELDFDEIQVNRWRCELPLLQVAVISYFDGVGFNMIGASLDRDTKFSTVDLSLAPKRKDLDTKALKMPLSFKDHAKNCTFLATIDRKLLLTAGHDGRIVVRNISALAAQGVNPSANRKEEPGFVCCRHDSFSGGIRRLSLCGQWIVTCGADGSVAVWNAAPMFNNEAPKRPSTYIETATRALQTLSLTAERPVAAEEEMFFLDQRKKDADERDRTANEGHRNEMKERVEVLRHRIREVRAENETAASDEQVDTEDFLVERDKMLFQDRVDNAIGEMRDEVKWKDLYADYVSHTLKTQCWDTMATKLTPLYSIAKPSLCVHSCHERAVPAAKLTLLRKLKFLRRIEETERAARQVHELEDLVARPVSEDAADGAGAEPERSPLLGMVTDLEQKLPPVENEMSEDVEPYLYSPLLAFTRQRAVTQIALLEIKSSNIVRRFNARFTELQAAKRSQLDKIKERNVQSVVTQKELDDHSELFQASLRRDEDPKTLLQVLDSEVPADKTHDPQEKRRVAAEEAERERWRRQHGNDDSSERALKLWMDGRLEKEIKTLKVDVQEPDFAIEGNAKYVPPDERNEEQLKLYKEYEKKLKARTEEVAARRLALKQQLDRLQKENRDAAKQFDEQLEALLLDRLQTAQNLSKNDLYRVKLCQSVAIQIDRETVLKDRERQRERSAEKAVLATAALERFKAQLDRKEQELNELMAEERNAEKNLRTIPPFNENEDIADRLIKAHAAKKKAVTSTAANRGLRKSDKESKSKTNKDKGAQAAALDAKIAANPDPFAFIDAEAEMKQRALNEEGAIAGAAFAQMTRAENIPEHLWDAFAEYVQLRVDGEREIKKLKSEVDDLRAEYQRLCELTNDLRTAAHDRAAELHRFREDARDELYDTDDLRMYRQGQVEVPQPPVATDFANAVLIHARDIHKLNDAIRERGNAKVKCLEDMMAQRSELRVAEWEVSKHAYQCKTLEMECRHLHTLRVTKQMQEFIHGGGDGYNEREREKLTNKINHVRATMSQKIEEKKGIMSKVKRATREREIENSMLIEHVGEAEALVETRRNVRDLQSSELEKERHNRLMRDMRVTRKLEDVAKAQQEEMMALRREIDRLRERTFPSFAVVSKRVIGNPDEA